jgi:hypothetical protein
VGGLPILAATLSSRATKVMKQQNKTQTRVPQTRGGARVFWLHPDKGLLQWVLNTGPTQFYLDASTGNHRHLCFLSLVLKPYVSRFKGR